MSGTLAPKQALILWCLLAKQGSALQSAIVPKVGKTDREALIAGRYVSVEKQARSLKLTVTDKGWNWAGDHFGDPLPLSYGVLQDWLARLDHHLAATGATLAEFVGSQPDIREVPAKSRKSTSRRSMASTEAKPRQPSLARPRAKAKSPPPLQLRARIEDAYLAITGGRKAQAVRLSALRAQLSDLDRATVDAGLATILRGDKTARLSQFTDPKALDTAEREAAYSPAGEPFHIIWIEP